MTLLAWPNISAASSHPAFDSDGYIDALCSLINERVREAIDDDQRGTLQLTIGDTELFFDFSDVGGDRVILVGPDNYMFVDNG
jgi:hypothetical protein